MGTRKRPLRILGFEPFDAGSHRAVRESITRHSHHDWTWLTRPGRAWKWRMRLGAIEMFEQGMRDGIFDQRFDVVFLTSLMSLADLRALFSRAGFPAIPFVLYLHENQVAYPSRSDTTQTRDWDANYALTNLTSALASDLAIFNSQWNRDSFIQGMGEILGKAPDLQLHEYAKRLESGSEVIWPPVEPPPPPPELLTSMDRKLAGPIRIAWPHRWEHDKGPDELLEIAKRYTEPLNLRWIILGERYREMPEALSAFQGQFVDRIDHFGFADSRDEYWRLLSRCDWVLSTANHEFFGLGVVEAMLAGCLPWLPERLSYPELLPDEAKGISPMNPPDDAITMRRLIHNHLQPAIATNAVARLDEAIYNVVVTS
ncbi:MAG: DUF3524 domain-containing protein [Planctomycetota bacterium]|nr:DUF3524 domain-containing protein [Planctomycetota bacterium]